MGRKTFFGDNITTFSQSEDCTIYRMKDESGDGIMTAIKVFPGITLIYNDFHMKNCSSQFHTKADFLCIDFCREGRIEWKLDNDTYVYMKAGDLQINGRENHIQTFGFPLQSLPRNIINYSILKKQRRLQNYMEGFLLI